MLSFNDFSKELLIVESIRFMDETIFKNIIAGKYDPKNNIIKEDNDKSKDFFENDEEIKLIKIYQDDPNSSEGRDALNKLVENKMKFIYSKVGKYINLHPDQFEMKDELVQNAALALIKAIEKFDINSNNIFTAYASKYIDGAIMNTMNSLRSISADKRYNKNTISVDQKISGDRGEWADKDSTVGDLIPDNNLSSNPYLKTLDDEKQALLADWINQLPDVEKTAIKMRFLGDEEATLKEIASVIGMTEMGAKKLIDRVVKKLRLWAEEMGMTEN
jgi:RNA polymerase sigma factor (sigma-70 family)